MKKIFFLIFALLAAAGCNMVKTAEAPQKDSGKQGMAPATSPIKNEICAQVITQAKNDQSGEIRSFPTPCDVPAGWTKISGSPFNIYINSKYNFSFKYPKSFIVADLKNSKSANNPEHILLENKKYFSIDTSIFPYINGQGQQFAVGAAGSRRLEMGGHVWWIDDDNQGGSTSWGGRRLSTDLSNQNYIVISVDSGSFSANPIDPKYAKYSLDQLREMEGQEIEITKIPDQIISSFKFIN